MKDLRGGLLLLEMDENRLKEYTYTLNDMKNVLLFALSESVSNYWPELALNWLQKRPEYLDQDVLNLIENISKNKKQYSQRTRHLALMISNNFLKNHSR